MAIFKPSEPTSNPESGWVTTTVLDTDIGTLILFKDMVGAAPMKVVFESVIAIPTLVRVRLLVPLPFSHQLTGEITRTR